jgi:hypothetical protein
MIVAKSFFPKAGRALRLMPHSTGWLVPLRALFTIPQAHPNLSIAKLFANISRAVQEHSYLFLLQIHILILLLRRYLPRDIEDEDASGAIGCGSSATVRSSSLLDYSRNQLELLSCS